MLCNDCRERAVIRECVAGEGRDYAARMEDGARTDRAADVAEDLVVSRTQKCKGRREQVLLYWADQCSRAGSCRRALEKSARRSGKIHSRPWIKVLPARVRVIPPSRRPPPHPGLKVL